MKVNLKKTLSAFAVTLLAATQVLSVSTSVLAQAGPLNVQIEVEIATLDPSLATDGTSMETMALMYDGLLEKDASGELVPAVAESYEVNEDETVYTFKLREDATWSNGDPVTAQDFVFSWQRLVNPETASEYSSMPGIAGILNADKITAGEVDPAELGVKAVDEKTLEVTLERPTPYFLSLLTFSTFYPINQAFFEGTSGQFATSPETVISNGAFILSSYQPAATSVELTKNEAYYNAANVTLPGITFHVIKDAQQAVLAYQTGQVDVAILQGEQVDLFLNDPEFKSIPLGYLWYLAPNIENEDLANQDLRLAIGKAYDRAVIVNNVLKDGSIPADFFIPQGLSNDPSGTDYRETVGTGLLATNLEEAQAHYEKAKEALGKDSFTIGLLVEDTEASIKVGQSLEAQIEQALPGVDIQLEQTPKKNRLERMREGDYDLGLTRWGPDYADPSTYLQLIETNSTYNMPNYSNADYDAGYAAIMTGDLVTDPQARFDKMVEMEALALSEGAILPVYQAASAVLTKANVSGINYFVVGTTKNYKYATKQ